MCYSEHFDTRYRTFEDFRFNKNFRATKMLHNFHHFSDFQKYFLKNVIFDLHWYSPALYVYSYKKSGFITTIRTKIQRQYCLQTCIQPHANKKKIIAARIFASKLLLKASFFLAMSKMVHFYKVTSNFTWQRCRAQNCQWVQT